MVDKAMLRNCSTLIRKNVTLKTWAEKKGFKYSTLAKFLAGHCGKRQIGISADILAALRADGYLDGAA